MSRRCLCKCHLTFDGIWPKDGVSTADVLEATIACPLCQNSHCAALLTPKDAPREKTAWVDPPMFPGRQDAEG